jgi:hypothetical protein
LGGDDVIEAMYPTACEDADGDPLDGAHRYQMRLDRLLAKAFWSVTMYETFCDGMAGYLVGYSISRSLIKETIPGLV